MTRADAFAIAREGKHLLVSFLHWWASELYGLVPPRLGDILRGRRQQLIVDLATGQAAAGILRGDDYRAISNVAVSDMAVGHWVRGVSDGFAREASVAIRLAPSLVLRKTISLPIAARHSIGQVLEFEIERHVPLKRADVYYDFRSIERSDLKSQIQVQIGVVDRGMIDALHADFMAAGLPIDRIGVADSEPGRILFNFRPEQGSIKVSAARRSITRGLWAAACLLLFLTAGIAIRRQAIIRAELSAELAKAKQGAIRAESVRKAVLDALSDQQFLPKKLQAVSVTDILARLSDVLPDDTWLDRLQIDGSKVTISGGSGSSSRLIALIDHSAFFEAAKFDSPITQEAGSKAEHFSITAALRPGVAP